MHRHASFLLQFDTLPMSQYKGMLENNYNVKFSIKYLFQDGAIINKLMKAARLGFMLFSHKFLTFHVIRLN